MILHLNYYTGNCFHVTINDVVQLSAETRVCVTDLDKQFPTSVSQQLMESDLHLKGRPLPLDKQILPQENTNTQGNV